MLSGRSKLFLILLTLLPLLLFAWLGWRTGRMEEVTVAQRYRELSTEQLRAENSKLQAYFDRLQRSLEPLACDCQSDPLRCRELVRKHPVVRLALIIDAEGAVVHPATAADLTGDEREFLSEIRQLLDDKDLVRRTLGQNTASADTPQDGWYAWHWGRGVQLIYWYADARRQVTVLPLSRGRWMADLLNVLPTTPFAADTEREGATARRIQLCDSSDKTVYQWGWMPDKVQPVLLSDLAVAAPLNTWRLKYFVAPEEIPGANWFAILGTWCAVLSGLIGLFIVLYRESTRAIALAAERVTFVNQVSHELRTPLTNIRLYADLLREDLARQGWDDTEAPLRHAQVIDDEAARLARMVANVLAFARAERHALHPVPRTCYLDEITEQIADHFRPLLREAGVAMVLELHSGAEVAVDPDFYEQILGNLLSNVEKYAASGKLVTIRTFQQADAAHVDVSDAGPGIPAGLRQQVFEPFVRVGNQLSDATGTGIGLSIARRLAQSMGGSLQLVDGPSGTTFRLSLRLATTERH